MKDAIKTQHGDQVEGWPALPYEAWRDTCQTLHMWTQIVGKVRMELSPFSQPLVACHPVRHPTRADHLGHSLPWWHL
jgi:uncharacterized protein DUF5996